MNYKETVDYLFNRTASYQQQGATAYKKDLTNIIQLCERLNNPQHRFKSIHIGGTNGKGSTSHLLTSVFMEAGYNVGTYTSPHYLDFRERIKINGKEISEQDVITFVTLIQDAIEEIQPSFFEITVAMAFYCFAQANIDIAMVEVGLGGRLDSTNIITPELSIITNIGLDHQQFLGDTLEEIATEKAGIIKPNIPVIIGKIQPETAAIFKHQAQTKHANIYFTEQQVNIQHSTVQENPMTDVFVRELELNVEHTKLKEQLKLKNLKLRTELLANYQIDNIRTAFIAFCVLQEKFELTIQQFKKGIENVQQNSPIIGRFQVLRKQPLTIADSCHNEDGTKAFFNQIKNLKTKQLHIIYGCVSDKKVATIKQYFPKDSKIYITEPTVSRKMPIEQLHMFFPHATAYTTVNEAYQTVLKNTTTDEIIVVIGSIFLIADLLKSNNETATF